MSEQKGFTLEVSSRYDGFWRYNVAFTCGCFDAEDNRTGFVSAESHIADAGSNLAEKPAEIPATRTVKLETPACDHLLCYLYIVPHTLPAVSEIDSARPFEVSLNIGYAGRKIRAEVHRINQWSGASVELRIGKE